MRKIIFSILILLSITVYSQTTMRFESSGYQYGQSGVFSTWVSTGSALLSQANPTGFKRSTTIGNINITVNNTALSATCYAQLISPALNAQTISGTVTGYARFSLSSVSGCTAQSRLKITVINRAGTVVATLLPMTSGVSDITTTLTSYQIANAAALTSYACAFGDRICIEIGIGRSAGTTIRTGTLSGGTSSATDITTAGSTSTHNPVLTFSNTLSFYNGITF